MIGLLQCRVEPVEPTSRSIGKEVEHIIRPDPNIANATDVLVKQAPFSRESIALLDQHNSLSNKSTDPEVCCVPTCLNCQTRWSYRW